MKASYQQLLIMLGEAHASLRLLETELIQTREELSEKMVELEKPQEKEEKKKK